MSKTRAFAAGSIAAAFAVASLFVAAPAYGAPLPGGQQITVVNSYDGQYYKANNDTAALSPFGAASAALLEEDDIEITGIDVDDNGIGYAVGTAYPEGADGAYLYAADANTGTLVEIEQITIFFPPDQILYVDECTAIDYTNGVVTLGCNDLYGDFDAAYIGVWDFDLGQLVDAIELTGDPAIDEDDEQYPNEPDNGFDYVHLNAIATDPISGLLYVFGGATVYEDDDPSFIDGVWTASQDAGLTLVSTTGVFRVFGADFDRGGQLWATVYRQDPPSLISNNDSGLATVTLASGDLPFQEPWADQELDVQAITVWGGLPATGSADLSVPIAATALLLLTGAILAGVTVVRRRRDAEAL